MKADEVRIGPIRRSLNSSGARGWCRRGSAVDLYERLTGGVSSDIWLVRAGSDAFCVKRALAAAPRRRPNGARRSSATRRRRRGCEAVGGFLPHAAPLVLGRGRCAGMFAMDYLPPQIIRSGRRSSARHRRAVHRRRGRRPSRPHPSRDSPSPLAAERAFATDATFMRSGSSPICWRPHRAHPDLRRALERSPQIDCGDACCPGPRRRQPEEHPGRAARARLPRRRMRLVRRPGLRSRLLPQSSAAEVRVGAGGRRTADSPRSTRWRSLSRRGRLGDARRSEQRAAQLLPALLLAQDRRQVTGRVPHRASSDRTACAACARPLCRPPARLADIRSVAARSTHRLRGGESHDRALIEQRRRPRASGIRAAARRSRREVVLDRRRRRAGDRARPALDRQHEAIELRDGGGVSAASASPARSPAISAEIAPALRGDEDRRSRRRSTRR